VLIYLKKAKYITSAILFCIVFVFIGEFYVWHLEFFDSEFDYTTFYLQRDTTQAEMINDIIIAAKDNGVGVFTIDRKIENIFSATLNIYCTDGVAEYLNKKSNLISGSYKSIFLGNVDVNILPFFEIPDISTQTVYSLIGDYDAQVVFKQTLVDKYAGKFPQRGNSSNDTPLMIFGVWFIVLSLFLLMTLYDVALLKKEVIVRMISGEHLSHFVARNVLKDIIAYIVLFVFSILIVSRLGEWTIIFLCQLSCFLFFCYLIH